jgi:hypothetical protein
MAAQGVAPRVAMEILGHAQISTTMNTYSHVAPELQRGSRRPHGGKPVGVRVIYVAVKSAVKWANCG